MTACPNAHSKRTPFVALRHVHAKLLYGGGMRGCLRVYDASRRARRSAAETWQLIPAAKCRPKSGCKDALGLPLFSVSRCGALSICDTSVPLVSLLLRAPIVRIGHAATVRRHSVNGCAVAARSPGGRRGRPFWEGNNGTFPHQPFLRPYGDKVFNSSSPVTPSCASSLANGIRSSASPSTL